jgi:MIP family channel proteins
VSAGTVYVNYLSGSLAVSDFASLQPTSPVAFLTVGLASGLMYAAALAVTLPAAGGYLNPAVTITLWVFKRLDGVKTVALIVMQFLGAILAGLALWALLGFRKDLVMASHLGTPQFNVEVFGGTTIWPLLKGIVTELIASFLLMFAIFGTVLDPRGKIWAGSWANRLAPLWIGLTLAALTLFAFRLTGAALNPARWLGPAIWDSITNVHTFDVHAVFWVGPIAGCLIAGWVYTALILPAENEQRLSSPASTNASGAALAAGSGLARAKR